MIERFVDYFQCSSYFPEKICKERAYKVIMPLMFYKRGYENEAGIRYYFGNPNSQKTLAVLSGRCLQNIRQSGSSDAEIINTFLEHKGRCSRIDLAVTEYIEETLVTLDEVAAWYKSDKIESSWLAGGCKMIIDVPKEDLNVTQTIYIGNQSERGKKGIFRAYDKGVEMNLDKHLITRLEVEDRGDKAQASARRIAEGASVASVFRTRFDVDEPEFERLMSSPVAELTRASHLPKRDAIEAQVARWQWLIKKVAPSIKQAIKDDKALGLDDHDLNHFLDASGLKAIMREAATGLANQITMRKLADLGLLEEDFTE